jgi:hypothetical protein
MGPYILRTIFRRDFVLIINEMDTKLVCEF